MLAISLILVIIALIGAPLFIVLGAGALAASFDAELSPDILIIEMNRLAATPSMAAIPLFILAGVIMSSGGAPDRLVRFYRASFGWMPGGLAIVTIIACAFFTMFSGASGVTILALGGLLYPILIEEKYRKRFTLGLMTTSGSLGLLFPPSLAIIIFGVVASVPIDELFLAGLIPGLLLMLMLSFYCYVQNIGNEVVRHDFDMGELVSSTRGSIWDLLLPVFLVGGIFGGYVSITEAAAFTATYVLLIETVIYRQIDLREKLYPILVESCVLFGSLLIILLIALGLTNLLVDAQVPMRLLEFIQEHIESPLEFLLLLNVFLLIVGAMMDIFSAIIVVTPLIMPLAMQYGINPVHLGIIFLANLEIGYCTPPVGINLYIASQRFGKPILQVFRSTLPFLMIMLIWLLLITYIPALSLWWQ